MQALSSPHQTATKPNRTSKASILAEQQYKLHHLSNILLALSPWHDSAVLAQGTVVY